MVIFRNKILGFQVHFIRVIKFKLPKIKVSRKC